MIKRSKIQKEQNTNTNEFHGFLGGNKPATVKAFRFTDLGHSPTFSGAAVKERTKQNHFTSFHFEYLINSFCYSILGMYINYIIADGGALQMNTEHRGGPTNDYGHDSGGSTQGISSMQI